MATPVNDHRLRILIRVRRVASEYDRLSPRQRKVFARKFPLLAWQVASLSDDLSELTRLELESDETYTVDPPELTEAERAPRQVPATGLYDAILSLEQRRPRLKDVWGGKGDQD